MFVIQLNELDNELFNKYLNLDGTELTKSQIANLNHTFTEAGENKYEHLEPWIQWPSIYFGELLHFHKHFRLGDCNNSNQKTILDEFEEHKIQYNSISAMNIKLPNNSKYANLFIPDPWSNGKIKGNLFLRSVYKTLTKLINNNAKGGMSFIDALLLATALTWYLPFGLYSKAGELLFGLPVKKWNKALLLDILLFSIAFKYAKKNKLGFNSVFLNAGAHLQHHYWFNSIFYEGKQSNPEWYIAKGKDPLRDMFSLYFKLCSFSMSNFKEFIIVTGLSQKEHMEETIYWRPKNHFKLLTSLGLTEFNVEPRMSRDFLVTCSGDINRAIAVLDACKLNNNNKFFNVSPNNDNELFVEICYTGNIDDGDLIVVNENNIPARKHLTFVAVKNAEHCSTGFVLSKRKLFKEDCVRLDQLKTKLFEHTSENFNNNSML